MQVFPFYGTSSFHLLDLVPSGRGLPPALVKDLAWQMLQALAYLHDKQVRGASRVRCYHNFIKQGYNLHVEPG